MGELDRVVIRPEVQEVKPRLFSQHVAMDGRYFDAIRAQCLDDRIHFVARQDEIPGDRRLAITGWLEVDPGGHAHRTCRGDRHSVHGDGVAAGNADLIDASVGVPLCANDLVDFDRI